jgi:hypothetical protein
MHFNTDNADLIAHIFSFLTEKKDLITVSYLSKLCRTIVTKTRDEFSNLFRNAHQNTQTMQIDNVEMLCKRKRTEVAKQTEVKRNKTKENTPLDKTINIFSSTINQNVSTSQIQEKIPQNANEASIDPLLNQANMPLLPIRVVAFAALNNPTLIPWGSYVKDSTYVAVWMQNPTPFTLKIVTLVTGPKGVIPNGMAQSLFLNPDENREVRQLVTRIVDSPLTFEVFAKPVPSFKLHRGRFSLNIIEETHEAEPKFFNIYPS